MLESSCQSETLTEDTKARRGLLWLCQHLKNYLPTGDLNKHEKLFSYAVTKVVKYSSMQ